MLTHSTEASLHSPAKTCSRAVVNVDPGERLLSAIAGGGFLALGLTRRSLPGIGLSILGGGLLYRALSGHCGVYQFLGIDGLEAHNRNVGVPAQQGFKFETSLNIERPAAEPFTWWRRLENLPHVIDHLESVEQTTSTRSHWVAKGPLNTKIEWDAEIFEERPNELIAWRSIPGSQLDTAGSIHFRQVEGNRATMVELVLKYDPPGGKGGRYLAEWLGVDVEQELREGMQRFKRLIESRKPAPAMGEPPSKAAQHTP